MKLRAITQILEKTAPLNYQESYDNSGLITGNNDQEISKVLLCLDCLESIVEEAIEKGCELIIAHHPIVFSGLKKLNGKNYIERVIIKAIKNDIAIYACHTNLDNVLKNGVNQKIAQKLGLKNQQILAPKSNLMSKLVVYCTSEKPEIVEKVRENLFANGAGHISDYSNCSFNTEGKGSYFPGESTNPAFGEKGKTNFMDETKIEVIVMNQNVNRILAEVNKVHPYEEVAYEIIPIKNPNQHIGSGMIGELQTEMSTKDFLSFLKKEMKTECIRHTDIHTEKVKKIAVCGGSGSFLLDEAKGQKADVFITADYKYHQFFDAENKIIIADIGHYESEQFTVELFEEILKDKTPGVVLIKTEMNTNPVNYL
jgi:dinuclear metal center YbgI/SA1388 family protein